MSSSQVPVSDIKSGLRLPTNVVPSHYDLTIRTDLASLSFSGTVAIHVDISEPVEEIVLHCAPQLDVKHVSLSTQALKTASRISPAKVSKPEDKTERLILAFPAGSLSQGKAILGLTFEGKLEGSMMGLCVVNSRAS